MGDFAKSAVTAAGGRTKREAKPVERLVPPETKDPEEFKIVPVRHGHGRARTRHSLAALVPV